MKICGYCGKENEDTLAFCTGCGTALAIPDETNPVLKQTSRLLNARSATIILLIYLAAQFLFTTVLSLFVASGMHGPNQHWDSQVPAVLALATVFAGVVMIWVSIKMIPTQLKDTSPNGAAWVLGRLPDVAKALAIGLVVGLLAHIFIKFIPFHSTHHGSTTLTHILAEGSAQKVWYVGGSLLVPLPEELLFRGILYGGYRKSFGSKWAIIITTTAFVLLHISRTMPAIVIITLFALIEIWTRLHFKAIGPAVALHFGYNAALSIFVFWKT